MLLTPAAPAPPTGYLYSYSDADYIAGVRPGTTRRWRATYPDLALGDESGASYHDAIQAAGIAALRERGFTLPVIRQMINFCQRELDVPHPFASEKFRVNRKHIFIEMKEKLIEVGRLRGQLAWSAIIADFLDELDFIDGTANHWWPMGKNQDEAKKTGWVLVSPDYAYGLPVVAGSFVRTEILQEQWLAGEAMAEISKDYGISVAAVECALSFEARRQHKSAA